MSLKGATEMTREFVRLFEFEKQCKRIGLSEDDVMEIENELLANPAAGDMVRGTGGIRKFRIMLPNRGKSSGARVVYVDFVSYSKTYLLTAFSKGETDNLNQAERNELKALVGILKHELGKKAK